MEVCPYGFVLEDLSGCRKEAAMLFFEPPENQILYMPHGKLIGMYFFAKVLDICVSTGGTINCPDTVNFLLQQNHQLLAIICKPYVNESSIWLWSDVETRRLVLLSLGHNTKSEIKSLAHCCSILELFSRAAPKHSNSPLLKRQSLRSGKNFGHTVAYKSGWRRICTCHMCVFHWELKRKWTKAHKEQREAGCWIKHCFVLFTAIPIASNRQAVAQGAQRDSNKSTLLPIYKTNLSDNNKEQWSSKRRSKKNSVWQPLTSWKNFWSKKRSAFCIFNSKLHLYFIMN